MLSVIPVSAFVDNYIWLLRDAAGHCVIVDPGEAAPVIAAVEQYGLQPRAILITHHHADHIGGIAELVQKWPLPVYGPAAENIRGVTEPLAEGAVVNLSEPAVRFDVMAVPGHTLGHIAYYVDQPTPLLFCGDTLFSAGCGRLFEGTPAQMLGSLDRLAALPSQTLVYCTHEYTAANLAFALSILPQDPALIARQQQVAALRAAQQPSLPSTLAEELRSNLFLRCAEPALQVALAGDLASDPASTDSQSGSAAEPIDRLSVFTALRTRKDHF